MYQKQSERLDNDALKAENQKLEMENLIWSEALSNTRCPNCDGLNLSNEEQRRQLYFHQLMVENVKIKEEVRKNIPFDLNGKKM